MREKRILVNNKPVTVDTKLKQNDSIVHSIHRHELPVVDGAGIEFLSCTKNYVVINKPSSIPVHPCGRYRKNSIVHILGAEYGLTELYCTWDRSYMCIVAL